MGDIGNTPYTYPDTPIGATRPLRVVCMGAGYSGLMMAIIMRSKMMDSNLEFQIYEKNADQGGTWLVNRYPGCQCDIPAHNYEFSFEPFAEWPNYYATSEQIHEYMRMVFEKYRCEEFCKFHHKIVSATWNDREGKWELGVESKDDIFTDICDVFINAGGVLDNWKWPDIPGIETFKGKLMHSASWDQGFDFTDKSVAVIGIGSSGIQILPQVAKKARHTTLFARSQTWITPSAGITEPGPDDPDVDDALNYSEKELARFKKDPNYLLQHRKSLQDGRIQGFKQFILGSPGQKEAMMMFSASMNERLGKSEKGRRIARQLIPEFPVGCRRLTPGQGFLETLLEDRVTLEWKNLDRLTENGILTKDGRLVECDAICCATGFDNSFKPRFPVIGKGNVALADQWSDTPEGYFGIAVSGFPNYFTFIGPNSPISNGSLVQAIQMAGIYIAKCISKIQTQSVKSMDVTPEAQADFNEHCRIYLANTVWSSSCSSWYKQGTTNGKVVAVYCGSSYHFIEALKEPRWEDYRFEYLGPAGRSNRFVYLGNGMTLCETRGKSVGATQTLNFEEYWNLFNLPNILA
ncbi:uncharacterized protein Z518_07406 [Rhinocladiella mackenziei CBS 650.93]|uniref:L-ornithine N(5)-oxygenase n=1 Tax=Rhinocladiella mackenziei CBS 650.93 TaxID=1442369 RepID=A0A0D2H099_9EURO|nr:uncharacterized protein Z518_07406 [Rhinocladiella mackenziei CBS 650.93]KIX03853.1 hypothetical protein Z518_07406 [Rhinocladiella mackenziei CBS 650.93]